MSINTDSEQIHLISKTQQGNLRCKMIHKLYNIYYNKWDHDNKELILTPQVKGDGSKNLWLTFDDQESTERLSLKLPAAIKCPAASDMQVSDGCQTKKKREGVFTLKGWSGMKGK